MKQTKILLVCPGNVIHSAIGEALLQKYAAEQNLPWIVHSAGTNRWRKSGTADPRAIAAAHLNHLDLTSHVPRRVTKEHFEDYDIIYSMATPAYKQLRALTREPSHLQKIQHFMDILYPGENRDTPDPWYVGTETEFLRCFETIDLACRLIVHQSVT